MTNAEKLVRGHYAARIDAAAARLPSVPRFEDLAAPDGQATRAGSRRREGRVNLIAGVAAAACLAIACPLAGRLPYRSFDGVEGAVRSLHFDAAALNDFLDVIRNSLGTDGTTDPDSSDRGTGALRIGLSASADPQGATHG